MTSPRDEGEKKPQGPAPTPIKFNVYLPDSRRARPPVEGEPEVIKMPRPASSGDADKTAKGD